MTQHYRSHGTSTEAVCGQDMVGRRNSSQLLFDDNTTCIKCRAVVTGRWLYVVAAIDEDGHIEVDYYTTVVEQLDRVAELEECDAKHISIYIATAESIPTDNPEERLLNILAAV